MMKNKKWIWAGLLVPALFFAYCEYEDQIKEVIDPDPIIGIQPFGNVDDEQIDSVMNAIEEMYDFKVYLLERRELPQMAYTEIRYPRYRADSLVEWISNNKPDSLDIVFGLTNQDISITKYKDPNKGIIKDPEWKYKDFGIFGLGRINGGSCVVSSNRLGHGGVGKSTFYKRLMRISCHEIGHTLGLHHCPESNCLMNDANESISTVDKSTGELCSKCWDEIH